MIALSKQIYEDETPIYANEAPHKGRSRVGKTPSCDQGRATRPSTHCTFTQSKIACCTGTCQTKNADTKEIEHVAVDAATQMNVGDTLIWDRLGRSGSRKFERLFDHTWDERAPSTLPGFFTARANGKEANANKIL